MKSLRQIVSSLLPQQKFDALAVGVIDFKQGNFEALEMAQLEGKLTESAPSLFYDLASLTKPLSNSLAYFLKPEVFDKNLLLSLTHRAGLPAWGLLPQPGWREQIKNYSIKESETLYSDFSALRVMIDLQDKGIEQKQLCQTVWDKEMLYWLDLPPEAPTLQYGFKTGLPNFGQVHDPNAYNLNSFCTHAGLFSTVGGLCRTLLNYQQKTGFIQKIAADLSQHTHRFSFGWDRVENPKNTMAGAGCGPKTFGHLGFTGTSIWIDPDLLLGHVILSNATKYHWYDKSGLNEMRKAIGEMVWKREM